MNQDLVKVTATGVDKFDIVRSSTLTCSRKHFEKNSGGLANIAAMWLTEDYPDIRDVIVEVKS